MTGDGRPRAAAAPTRTSAPRRHQRGRDVDTVLEAGLDRLGLRRHVGNRTMARASTDEPVLALMKHAGQQQIPPLASLAGNRAMGRALSARPDLGPSIGQPLDPATRAFMESRFGHDFGAVRVHTDAPAAASARTLDARAYALGNTIVFDDGEFAPTTAGGRRLLAHELAHVVQQQRGGAGVGGDDARSERAADDAERSVLAGGRVPDPGASPVRLARKRRREHGKLIEREEALRLLLPLASFGAAQDPSLGAMNVIREVLLGPRTDENAAERWHKLEAACSLLTAQDAVTVRRVLTQPAAKAQKQLRDAFRALTHVVQDAVLKVLDARIAAPPVQAPPSLAELPDTAAELVSGIKRLPATYSDQDVANWVARSMRELGWQRVDVQQPVLAALAEQRPRAFRAVSLWLATGERKQRQAAEARRAEEQKQFERDVELSKRSPGFVHMAFGPAHTMHTYRDLSHQIRNPVYKFQSQFGTTTARQAGTNQLAVMGIAGGAIALLYAAAMVAPVAAEAAPAIGSAASTAVRVVGGELSLAGGALRWAGQRALLFYLHNPILVNEIGLLTTELVLSVEGDVPGLLKACAEDPAQAAVIFMQVWVLHAQVRTPSGRNYDATLEVQPLPPNSQQGNALKFRTVSVTATPVGEPAPTPALKVVQGGGQPSGAPAGMLRDADTPGSAVDVSSSHPVFKGKTPANDPPPQSQDQKMKVAVNAPPQDVPAGTVVDTPPAKAQQGPAIQATTKKPPTDPGPDPDPGASTPAPKASAVTPDPAAPVAAAPRTQVRRFPGRNPPDIAVIEVGNDNSVTIVTANRADVAAKTKTPGGTHIVTANSPDGLGPNVSGARRYRANVDAHGKISNVEPLDRAAQDPDVLNTLKQALRRTGLVSPAGTRLNLDPSGPPDSPLKDFFFR